MIKKEPTTKTTHKLWIVCRMLHDTVDAQTDRGQNEWTYCSFYPSLHLQVPWFLSQKMPSCLSWFMDPTHLFYKQGLIHFWLNTSCVLVLRAVLALIEFYPLHHKANIKAFVNPFLFFPAKSCLTKNTLWKESGFPLWSYSSTEASTERRRNVLFTQTAGSSDSRLLPVVLKAGYWNILLECFRTQNQHFAKWHLTTGEIAYL